MAIEDNGKDMGDDLEDVFRIEDTTLSMESSKKRKIVANGEEFTSHAPL